MSEAIAVTEIAWYVAKAGASTTATRAVVAAAVARGAHERKCKMRGPNTKKYLFPSLRDSSSRQKHCACPTRGGGEYAYCSYSCNLRFELRSKEQGRDGDGDWPGGWANGIFLQIEYLTTSRYFGLRCIAITPLEPSGLE